jgi:hypothetical protein
VNEVRDLTERERSIIKEQILHLKSEIERIDTRPGNQQLTSKDYLDSLGWFQYEGISIDLLTYPLFSILLLVSEYLCEKHGFRLLMTHDLLVLAHERIEGYAPLELLAYRPLQPGDGNWLDEDDAIDRVLSCVEKIDNALGVLQPKSAWLDILLGRQWLQLMR